MAREISVIQKQIINSVQADSNLYDPTNPDTTKQGLTSLSKTAIWNLWTYIIAVSISLFEQVLDIYKASIETDISLAAVGTAKWIQQQCFLFQWSATTPQVVQLNTTTFSPYYPVVNEDLRIVTQAAVTTTPNKLALIKVANNSVALTSPQQDALRSYLDFINFAGVYFQLRSVDADFIMLGYDIYFDGQYSSSIQSSVTTAITNFLSTSNFNNFNGTTTLLNIQDVIQAVPGVTDVVERQVEVRAYNVVAANATVMVSSYTTVLRNYVPFAGYMIVDTDAGRTLSDTLTFIVN